MRSFQYLFKFSELLKLCDVPAKAAATFSIPMAIQRWDWFVVSPDGKSLATWVGEADFRIWDLTGPKPESKTVLTRRVKIPDNPSMGIFSADGKSLICAKDSTIWTWDLTRSKPLEQDLPTADPWGDCRALALSSDGKILASGHYRGLILWDLEKKTKKASWKLPIPVRNVSFAPNGRHLIVATASGPLYVLRLE